MITSITGFSKFTKEEKIAWLSKTYLKDSPLSEEVLRQYWNPNSKLQQLHEEFTENTISNFYLPFGIAPNFEINGKIYAVPMAIEESSVIAAASKAAKFWKSRGGFKAEVLSTVKIGQIHFLFNGEYNKLIQFFKNVKPLLLEGTAELTKNMRKRGGGVIDIEIRDKSTLMDNYFQLHCSFETADSMGANFINSCLEKFAEIFKAEAKEYQEFKGEEKHPEIIMSILSNYVPECIVRAEVSCPVEDLKDEKISDPNTFAEKFLTAVKIAEVEPYRAVTHNKGIMNGIDAVVLATGNDFRAVEAGIHAYASKDGKYTSLTHAEVKNNIFKFWMEIPLAVGTVGGLTNLHPLVKVAMEILQKPSAQDLMKIIAVAGLAQNFAAVKSLVTTGIQQGHMKMHLINILNQQKATADEKDTLINYFKNNTVTHSSVVEQLEKNSEMKQNFHSNGKLLITGEYLVLDGAVSLAVPANFGQYMEVDETTNDIITWTARDHNNKEWFKTCFSYDGNKFDFCEETKVTGKEVTTLLKIFNEAHSINPEVFNAHSGFNITTRLDFPQNWGLGSSSTLINNVASWLRIDPYILLRKTFGGSGYDIAAAQAAQPFTFQLNVESRSILNIDFNPPFKHSLFFVHLNRKQNSRNSIAHYRQQSKEFIEDSIQKISSLTNSIIKCETLEEFNLLLEIHETLISKIINIPKIKTQFFSDFKGGVKSLGGWGGDFILATGGEKEKDYFRNKGYHTILSYSEMVK